eukprot:ANDGO_04673.mRNA.1 hypothetical protein
MRSASWVTVFVILAAACLVVRGQGGGDPPYFKVLATLREEGFGRNLLPFVLCDPLGATALVQYEDDQQGGLTELFLSADHVLTRGPDRAFSRSILNAFAWAVDFGQNAFYTFNYTYLNRLDLVTGQRTGSLFFSGLKDQAVVDSFAQQLYVVSGSVVRRIDLVNFSGIDATGKEFDGLAVRLMKSYGSTLFVFTSTSPSRTTTALVGTIQVLDAFTLQPLQQPIEFWREPFPEYVAGEPHDLTPVVLAEDPLQPAWFLYFHGHLLMFSPLTRQMSMVIQDMIPDEDFTPLTMVISESGNTMSIGGYDENGIATVLTLTRSCSDQGVPTAFGLSSATTLASDAEEVVGACVLDRHTLMIALQSSAAPRVVQVALRDYQVPWIENIVLYPRGGISDFGPGAAIDEERRIMHIPVRRPVKGIATVSLEGPMSIQNRMELGAGFQEPLFLQAVDSGATLVALVPYINGTSEWGDLTGVNYLARIDAASLVVQALVPMGSFSFSSSASAAVVGFDPSGRYLVFTFVGNTPIGLMHYLFIADLQTWTVRELANFPDPSDNFHHREDISIIPGTFEAYVTETSEGPVAPVGSAIISRRNLLDYSLIADVFRFSYDYEDSRGETVDPRNVRFYDLQRNVANFGQIEVDLTTNQYTIVDVIPNTSPEFSMLVEDRSLSVVIIPAGTFDTYTFLVANTTDRRSASLALANNLELLFTWFSEGDTATLVKAALSEEAANTFVEEIQNPSDPLPSFAPVFSVSSGTLALLTLAATMFGITGV